MCVCVCMSEHDHLIVDEEKTLVVVASVRHPDLLSNLPQSSKIAIQLRSEIQHDAEECTSHKHDGVVVASQPSKGAAKSKNLHHRNHHHHHHHHQHAHQVLLPLVSPWTPQFRVSIFLLCIPTWLFLSEINRCWILLLLLWNTFATTPEITCSQQEKNFFLDICGFTLGTDGLKACVSVMPARVGMGE